MLIKVCGLTRYEDVCFCDKLGINMVGFIFYPKSPRFIYSEKVQGFSCDFAKKVGVFVKHDICKINKIIEQAGLDLIQLHGPYSINDCIKIGTSRVIKVIWPDSFKTKKDFLNEVRDYSRACKYLLFDAGTKGGGHGIGIKNIEYLRDIPNDISWLIAGGVCLNNISYFLGHISPHGIDMNSGVESSPGIKDKKAILKIFKKIKETR